MCRIAHATPHGDDIVEALQAEPEGLCPGVYATRGERDQAFAWLECSYAKRDIYLPYVKSNPITQDLRSDPRYAAFLLKLGLLDRQ